MIVVGSIGSLPIILLLNHTPIDIRQSNKFCPQDVEF